MHEAASVSALLHSQAEEERVQDNVYAHTQSEPIRVWCGFKFSARLNDEFNILRYAAI